VAAAQQPAAAAAQPAPQQQQPSTPAAQPAQQQPASAATPPGGMPAWVAPLQKGMQLQQGGRWAEAADAYKEACAHEMPLQQAVAARSNLGLAFQNTEQYERALAAYDDALKLAPTYADGHHNRGNALYKLGRFADAAEAFGTAVKCARVPQGSTDTPAHAPHASRSSSLHILSGLYRPTESRTSTAATPSTNWGATTRPPPPSVRC
jgi:tetratricopeptide (TPR) repeat protein